MKKWLSGFGPPLLVAGLLVLALTSPFWAVGGQPAFKLTKDQEKQINETLKDVINKGARIFNEDRDYQGCYRLFEGALLTTRPLLAGHPDLQAAIDKGIQDANANPSVAQKGFELRKILDQIRERFGSPPATGTKDKKPGDVKPTDVKPTDVKPTDKKPTDVKPTDVKPTDKKPTDVKPTDVKPTDKKPTDVKPTDVKPTDKKPTDKVDPTKKTLWDNLGGEANVGKIVDDFIATASKDPKVNFDQGGKFKINVPDLRKKLIELVSATTGGPYKYSGKSMAEAHKGMKITAGEFDAAVNHLKAAMQKNGVKPADAGEVLKIVEATRKDIVGAAPVPPVNPPNVDPNKDKKEPPKVDPNKDKKEPPKVDPNKDKKEPPKVEPSPVKPGAQVKGKITLSGKPLSGVLLSFVSATGNSTTTNPAADGTYSLQALAAGKYKVTVRPLPVTGANPAPKVIAVPLAYTEAASTPLTVEVVAGSPSEFNFDLK